MLWHSGDDNKNRHVIHVHGILAKEAWGLPWQGARCRGRRDRSGEVGKQPLRESSNEERMGWLSKLLRM